MSKIQIINPQPGCARFTTRESARRYVRQARAEWFNGGLRFLSDSERHKATCHQMVVRALTRPPEDRVSSSGMARLDQVQGLPCAGPAIRVFTILSKTGPGRRSMIEVATECDLPV